MIETKELKQAIKMRTSVRTFDGNGLKPEHEKMLKEYLLTKENRIGVFGSEINIQYLTPTGEEFKSVGTYGVIKSAPAYLAISCKKTMENMVDCGYIIENLVLFLASIGIGSCWLGGTFKRQQLSLKTELAEDEFIPILLPIGYENLKKSFTDKAIRTIARSHSREPFNTRFFMNTFEESITEKELLDQLEFVKMAPSASNKQPWRLLATKEAIDFYIARTPNYDSERLGYDIQMIDIGIALAHYNLVRSQTLSISSAKDIGEISQSLNIRINKQIEHEVTYINNKKESVSIEYAFTVER